MRARVYESIDEIGCRRVEALRPGIDFAFGVLRAMERTLWGELMARYVTVEEDATGALLAFTPVYIGSNLNVNALMPRIVQTGYDALVRAFGTAVATRVAVAGTLISDRGWIPMAEDLADRQGALRLLLAEFERLGREHHAQLGIVKDLHAAFPEEDRALIRASGFTEACSLPTIRINTAYRSFEEYLSKGLSKNGRRHARKQFNKAEGTLTVRAVEQFEALIPSVFALHRAVYLKAKYQLEELPPRFFAECARSTSPRSELLLCETAAGRLVGSMMVFYTEREQQNKRIGIEYDVPDSGLIYNLLNYVGIQRAIERRIPTLLLGQSSYLTKTRLGGELEQQYLLIKAYDVALKPTLPLQRWWMQRYSAANIAAAVEKGLAI